MVLLILSFTELLLASHLCSVRVGYYVLATVLSPGTGWGWGVTFLAFLGSLLQVLVLCQGFLLVVSGVPYS